MKPDKTLRKAREAELSGYHWGDSTTLQLLLAATALMWFLGVVHILVRFVF